MITSRVNPLQDVSVDYTPQLKQLMQQVGFSYFRSLSEAANVSEKQLRQLRQGRVANLQIATVQKLAEALQVSITDLLTTFSRPSAPLAPIPAETLCERDASLPDLQAEYDRLHRQLEQQKELLLQEFQQSSLHILESLLLQLPTAAHAAQQNPQLAAVKLLPLLRPIDALLQSWGIEAIGQVGSDVSYDPQQHQLMEGMAAPGDRVRVRYIGYRQGHKLLYRAKVSPI